jgi:hypothetical protein
MRLPNTVKAAIAAIAVAALAIGVADVTAGASGSDPAYYACLSGGSLTKVGTTAPTCSAPATRISWDQTGPQGPAGNTILSGTGAPASTIGLVGNFYLETSNHKLYGPATRTCSPLPCRTVWGSGTSLVGPGGFVYQTTTGDVTGAEGAPVTVATQTVPVGGDFSVSAGVEGVNSGINYATEWLCSLEAANPGGSAVTLDTVKADGAQITNSSTPMTLQGVVSLAAHGTISIHCGEDLAQYMDYYTNARITTTQISGFSIVPAG